METSPKREDSLSPEELPEFTPEELERILSDAMAEEEHNTLFPDWRKTPFVNPLDPSTYGSFR